MTCRACPPGLNAEASHERSSPKGRGELDVPDNWWNCDIYYNVPLRDLKDRRITDDHLVHAVDRGIALRFEGR